MKPNRCMATMLALAALVTSGGVFTRAGAQNAQDDPFEKLKTYDYQGRGPVEAIRKMIDDALTDKAAVAQIEQKLDAVLDDPMATLGGKQEAARFLWIIGSARSVPTLSKLLTDEKLSDVARYALERESNPAAGKALRLALATTKDKILIGIINSIGNRGDAEAVSQLKPLVTHADAHVAEAVIAALGKIGTDSALAVLRAQPANSLQAGHAMLRCAEHFAATGKKAQAERLLEGLAGAGRPPIIQVEALRALVSLPSSRASAVVFTDLKSPDAYVQQSAARIGGTLKDPAITKHLIAVYPMLPVPSQIVVLAALAERGETSSAPLALTAVESQEPSLRTEGIHALAQVGGVKAVSRLVDMMLHGEGSDRRTAREGLAVMRGADVEQALLKMVREGQPEVRTALIGVLVDRPTPAVMTTFMESSRGSETRNAVEALRALGRLGGANEHPELVKLLVSTQSEEVRDAAKDAVVAIGQRLGNRDRAAEPLLAALPGASVGGKAALLQALAEIGGDRALEELTNASGSNEEVVKQAAIRALTETWSDSRPLPTLLNIAKSDPSNGIKVQAMRGYLRLVGQDDRMPAETKVEKINDAVKAAIRPEEKKQALSVLRDCRVVPAMELAASMLDDPALFPEAADTVIYLAGPRRKDNRNQAAVTGASTNSALDKVIQLTKDDNQKEQAQKLKGA